jgi:starch-binding outer membrane protein, SusD/RagB family
MKANIILSILLFTLLSGCKDGFLEIPSKTSLSKPVYFKTQVDFEQAINGTYAPLRSLYGGYHGAYVMGELRSDNTTYKFNPNDRGTIQPELIKDFLAQSTSGVLYDKYSNDYAIISRANQILDLIDGVDFDGSVKSNIKGQAYFLRAFAYFDLVQYFGQVPLHIKYATTLSEAALPLSSVSDIYKQIISDAGKAAELLPNKATQEKGRVTTGSAKMLLGNVYIVQKEWLKAETVLKSITGYSLLPNYADVFDPTQKNNSESIFEIQYKKGIEGFASNFFYIFLVQPISAEEISAVTGIPEVAKTIEGYNIPTPDLIDAYENNDLRKGTSIGYITASGVSYPYIKKYAHPHELTNNTDDDWPVYRYSEVLLFVAEALNEQNKTSEALPYLNQVRVRAGLASSQTVSQSDVREAIMKERRVELAFENKRWLDLVRTNQAVQVMTAYGSRVKANPQAYYFPMGITVAPSAYTKIDLLFPIPASEASLNPNF